METEYESLCGAVQAFDEFMDATWNLACLASGSEDPPQATFDAAHDLIVMASDAVTELSERARHARLRALWKDFLDKHAHPPGETVGDVPPTPVGIVN